MANYYDISIALAGVCQSAQLVYDIAHHGTFDKASFEHSLSSLFVTQPDSTFAVYENNPAHLKVGLETALAQFNGAGGKNDREIGRYWISILALSSKFNQSSAAKNALAERLQLLQRQVSLYENGLADEQMISNIATAYSDIISPLGSRIQVFGQEHLLRRPDIQNRIRAALLAGIRAGILWQQVGGSRWQFLFSRKKILQQVQTLYGAF